MKQQHQRKYLNLKLMETSGKPVETNGKPLENQWKPVQTNGNQCIEESIKGNSQLISCYFVNAIVRRKILGFT